MLRHLKSMLMCGGNSHFPSINFFFSKMKDWNSDFFYLFIDYNFI